MPQLDQVTFLSQFFWLCVFFFGFYFVICKHFLPKAGRILKFRKKKMNLSAEGVQSMQQENEKVRASCKAVVENGLNVSGNFLLSHLQRMESWLNDVVIGTNKKEWRGTNTVYVEWVGDNSIRQQLALGAATPFSSPEIFTSILAEKCKNRGQGGKQDKIGVPLSRPDTLDQFLWEKRKRETAEPPQGGKSRTSKR